MAASGKKLGKLSLAILENFVEGTLGKKFVEELRAPTDQTLAIQTALEHTEAIFRKNFDDQDLAHAIFVDLPIDPAKLDAVIVNFFEHPTDPDFSQNLESLLTSEFHNLSRERIQAAVEFFIKTLKQELALADSGFREKIRLLSDLETLEYIRGIEKQLKQKPVEAETPRPSGKVVSPPRQPADPGSTGMTNTSNQLKVFLCHGSDDISVVEKLSDDLVAAGFEPWLDSEVLVPGMDKDREIGQAMRASDAVIVCFSAVAVREEGHIQKELKLALDIQAEKPGGTIFTIPLRLDHCEIPFEFRNLHWSEYTATNGFEQIVRALNVRAKQLGKQLGDAKKNDPNI